MNTVTLTTLLETGLIIIQAPVGMSKAIGLSMFCDI